MDILIVEDKKRNAEELEIMLRACLAEMSGLYSGEAVIENRNKGKEVLYDIEEGSIHPDIIFIPIRLGRSSGIKIASRMKSFLPMAQIIFIAGENEYDLDVYSVEHVYTVERPIEYEVLSKALTRAINRIGKDSEYFECVINRRRHYIPFHNILYFENVKRKVTAHTDLPGEQTCFYATMAHLEKSLPHNFVRCHNSFIVNLDRISSYGPSSVIVGGKEIVISRKYKDGFKERVGE